jgi:phage shock protein A
LTLAYRDEQITSYRVKAPAAEDRALLIEQPRYPDWELISPKPSEVELTRGQYRIRQALARGGATVLDVTIQRPRQTVVQLASLNRETLLGYARTGGVPENVRQALERLAGMQGEVDRLDRQIKEIGTERDAIARDQGRLRDNLKSVPAGGDLAKRYLDNLKSQEDRLDKLRLAEDDAKQKLTQARAALADAIAKLEI